MAGIDGASSFPGDEGDTMRGKEGTSSTGQLAGYVFLAGGEFHALDLTCSRNMSGKAG